MSEGTTFDDELKPVIDETEDCSTPLREVWADDYPPYQQMDRNHQTVVHDDGYVCPALLD